MVKETFDKIKDVEPEDEKDYYRLGRWMAGRKFMFRIAAAVFLLGIAIIRMAYLDGAIGSTKGYPTYRYNSILLKFRTGKAGILAKSGYTAYIGQVKKGTAEGKGTLYGKSGSIIYKGEFEASLYHGKGTLYRNNGTRIYTGQFEQGRRQGEGKLYNGSGSLIYKGSFENDEILYEEITGKKTEDIAGMYTGNLSICTYEEENSVKMCGIMEEIDAVYCGTSTEDSMEGGYEVTKVYVIKDNLDGETVENLGDPEYKGTTRIKFPEAVVMNELKKRDGKIADIPAIQKEDVLKDVSRVSSYDKSFKVYIRTYVKEGFRYTFYSSSKNSSVLFYSIETDQA